MERLTEILEKNGLDAALKAFRDKRSAVPECEARRLVCDFASHALQFAEDPALVRALELIRRYADGVDDDRMDTIGRAEKLAIDAYFAARKCGDRVTMYVADAVSQAATSFPLSAAYLVAERAALAAAISAYENTSCGACGQRAWDEARQAQCALFRQFAETHSL